MDFESGKGWNIVVPSIPVSMEDLSDIDIFGEPKPKRKEFISGAVRDSLDKLRYDLIPHEHTTEMAKVLSMGASKYGPRNWEKGIPFSELYASAARHIASFLAGEERDSESGLLHTSHVCWNFMAIEVMQLRGKSKELDDLTAGSTTSSMSNFGVKASV